MGSPLGVTFANFYMCDLKIKLIDEKPHLKPHIYCRYSDIFVVTHNMTQIEDLKTTLLNNSVLMKLTITTALFFWISTLTQAPVILIPKLTSNL